MFVPEGGVGCGSGCDIEPLEAVLTDGACGILGCDYELGIGVAGGAGGAGGRPDEPVSSMSISKRTRLPDGIEGRVDAEPLGARCLGAPGSPGGAGGCDGGCGATGAGAAGGIVGVRR